jgi:hypothetical protein
VGAAQTYGTKYTAQAVSILNKTYILNIKEKAYTGASTEVVASAIPFVRSLKGESDVLEDRILRTSFKITLEDQSDGTFRELFTYDWKKFIVEIWKDSVIYWTGFLTPDYYSEPWTDPPYSISFEAHDGLGQLKNLDFVKSNEDRFTGKIKLSEVVAQCLWKIMPFYLDRQYDGHGIGGLLQTGTIYEAINVFEEHQDHAKSMLTETYLEVERFYQDGMISCYDALHEVLKLCNGQLFQQDGYWWIVSIGSRKSTTLAFKQYTITETESLGVIVLTWVLTTSGTYNQSQSITTESEPSVSINVWYDAPTMTILPGWKQFSVKQNLGYKSNLFATTDYSVIGTPNITVYQEGDVIPASVLGTDKSYTCTEHTVLFKDSNKNQLLFNLGTFTKHSDQVISIQLDFIKNVKVLNSLDVDARIAIRAYINSGATTYWLDEDGSWSTDSHEIYAFEFQSLGTGLTVGVGVDATALTIPSTPLPIDGSIVFEFQATNLGSAGDAWALLIQNSCVKVELLGLNIVESLEVITHINDKQNYIPSTQDMMFGDFIDVDNNIRTYAGGLWYLDGTYKITANWHITDSTVLKPLINLIADEIGVMHIKPVWMISGQLMGNLKPITTITDTYADRKFIPIRMDEDVYNAECDCDLIEVAPEDQGYLQLKQGGYLLLKGGGKIKLKK